MLSRCVYKISIAFLNPKYKNSQTYTSGKHTNFQISNYGGWRKTFLHEERGLCRMPSSHLPDVVFWITSKFIMWLILNLWHFLKHMPFTSSSSVISTCISILDLLLFSLLKNRVEVGVIKEKAKYWQVLEGHGEFSKQHLDSLIETKE